MNRAVQGLGQSWDLINTSSIELELKQLYKVRNGLNGELRAFALGVPCLSGSSPNAPDIDCQRICAFHFPNMFSEKARDSLILTND